MTRVGSVLSPLLVGRDDVIELAGRRLDEALAGHGQFVLLSGEAGIGKTRLLRAIRQLGHAKGFVAQGGDLAPQDRDVPAASFLEMARSAAKSETFKQLSEDLLAILLDVAEAERPQRRQLVRRSVDAIEAAITRPVMLFFDDLQWADDVSLEILGELARQTRGSRVFIAGAYRTEATRPGSMLREWRARLVTQRLVEEIRLERLTLEETGLVATLILATGLPAPRDVVSAIHERTDGVPLHIEELLGAVRSADLVDGRAIRHATVPETLEDAILARVGRLSDDAQAVARAGAVIGRCFVPEVLAGIMDRPVRDLDAPLEELVQNSILHPFEYVDRGYFDFRHQVLRDALYDSVPATLLRTLHARAGEFGAALSGASEVHASVHFERAGMPDRAFEAAVRGARLAAKLSSHREALDLYRRAFDNLPPGLPTAERADVIEAYGEEAAAIDDNDLEERLAREARALHLEAGQALRAAGCLLSIASSWRREGRPIVDRERITLEAIAEIEAVPAGPDRDESLADAYMLLGWTHMDAMRLDEARAAVQRSLALVAEPDLEGRALWAQTVQGMLDAIDGRIDEGLAAIRRSADESRARGLESAGVTAYRDASLSAIRSMDYREAARGMSDARRYADAIEQSHCARVMASTDAVLAWASGDWAGATQIGEQALADRRGGRAGAIARWGLGFVAAGRGDADSAVEHLSPALDFGERAGWLEMAMPARWGLAEAALMAGDPDVAIRHCEDALQVSLERGERSLLVPFVVTGVRAFLAAGRPEAASAWFDRVLVAVGPSSPVSAPAIEHGRGLTRLAAGAVTTAREALAAAVDLWDARGRAWEANWARLDLAGAMLRSNRYVDAVRLVGEVREMARRMDSPPLLARAAELERIARGRGSEQDPWHPLTVREFEVARAIAGGKTNAEIASDLFVSPKTVSAHVEHILAKLGASRRAEIAAWVTTIAQPVA